jgi:diacylglycerol kinase family enzyme
MRFVVVVNPKAGRFRAQPRELDAIYRVTSAQGYVLAPTSLPELVQELRELVEDPPEMIAVAGGDGTVSQVTTALLSVWPHESLPDLALLDGGTMNTIARSLGTRRASAAVQLDAIVGAPTRLRARRWPLRIGHGRYGWMFGTGIVARYIQAYDRVRPTGPIDAARVLRDRILAAALGTEPEFFEPQRLDVDVDGERLPLKAWLAVAMGGSHDLGLGFRPFPGLLQAPGKVGLFASGSSPVRLAADLAKIRFQAPVRHSLTFQRITSHVRLASPQPILFTVDGDLEETTERIDLTPGPPITFRLPPDARPPTRLPPDPEPPKRKPG